MRNVYYIPIERLLKENAVFANLWAQRYTFISGCRLFVSVIIRYRRRGSIVRHSFAFLLNRRFRSGG
jgi:hypothetical protein